MPVPGRQAGVHLSPTPGSLFRMYHWMSPDIKVRRLTHPGLPPLGAQVDYLDFATHIGDLVDAQNFEEGDATGVNRVFVEVHNRSLTEIPGGQVSVLLLMTDATMTFPPLPSNWVANVDTPDPTGAWLAGSSWHFADAGMPYRVVNAPLNPRTPAVVEFTVDFSSLSLPAGHDHLCLAAFISAPADRVMATSQTNFDIIE